MRVGTVSRQQETQSHPFGRDNSAVGGLFDHNPSAQSLEVLVCPVWLLWLSVQVIGNPLALWFASACGFPVTVSPVRPSSSSLSCVAGKRLQGQGVVLGCFIGLSIHLTGIWVFSPDVCIWLKLVISNICNINICRRICYFTRSFVLNEIIRRWMATIC